MPVDTIVVGAGAAGCVVARLLADRGHRVILVEAGLGEPRPEELKTIEALPALGVTDRFWESVRVSGHENRWGPYRIGRGLGGGAAVNSMVLMTGARSDYDAWEQQYGAVGWRWSSLEPWFDVVRGRSATITSDLGPLALAVRDAATDLGHTTGEPSIEPDGRGFGPTSLACDGARRVSPVEAFLQGPDDDGALPRLEVRAGQSVQRIRFRDRRAVGVELSTGAAIDGGQVIVCAGALGSPALLARSGIGSAPYRLVDHPSFVFSVGLRPEHRLGRDRPIAPISGILRWGADQQEAGAGSVDVVAQVMDHVGRGPSDRHYGSVIVSLLGARSVGRFRPAGAGFEVDPGWFTDPEDRRRMILAVRHVGELMASSALADVAEGVFLDDQGTPVEVMASWSDGELLAWLRTHPGPVHHPASSLGLGAGSGAVGVDPDGAVRGRRGLFLADASVLPHLPTANPQLPVMAVAARIADGLVEL